MNKLTTKNWMRVRLNKTTKCITFTNDTTYKNKADCEMDIKSAQYIAINLKALNKLVSEGYTINEQTIAQPIENVVEVTVLSHNVIDTTVNEKIERQIEEYTKAKIERDILAYETKKNKQLAIERFLSTPPKQAEQKPFDYSKQIDKFYSKQQPRNQRDKQRQIADYCNEVVL